VFLPHNPQITWLGARNSRLRSYNYRLNFERVGMTMMENHRLIGWSLCLVAVALAGCASEETPAVERSPENGERFFANLRQLTFSGQNAEAYFSPDGRSLIFQRTGDEVCDQQYVIGIDGSNLRRVSNGLGRTTCGYFFDGGSRILYSSTFHAAETCPPPPDYLDGLRVGSLRL
jgi:hypothetical protein